MQEFLPAGSNPIDYYRYGPFNDPTPTWYSWPWFGQTGAELGGNPITLHFTDGQTGDDDQLANGTIVDAGPRLSLLHSR